MSASGDYIEISEGVSVKKNQVFWLLQFFGWIIFSVLFSMSSYIHLFGSENNLLLSTIIFFTLGFSITSCLRYLYRFVFYRITTVVYLWFLIMFTSLLVSSIWFFAGLVCSSLFIRGFTFPEFRSSDIFTLVLYYNLGIMLWSTLYFFIHLWLDWVKQKRIAEKNRLLFQEVHAMMRSYQLNPHFLFNSLNSIQTLVYQNPKVADKMIASLSEFLRYNLSFIDLHEILLIDEIKIIKQYLRIEKIRFEERLEYQIEVADETEELKILPFLIQPFVENATKFGMRTNPKFMSLKISTFIYDDNLNIEISNSGKWVDNHTEKGMGIRNVKERLRNAYPQNHELLISNSNGWVDVLIKINIVALINLEQNGTINN